MSAVQAPLHGEEPPMYLQRPSSARSQDVTHILARTFRQLFTRDSVAPDTVQNLTQSKGGDDPYHEKYVEQLQKVQEERERRLAEAAMLERHIMQAQARAMSADERALQRVSSATQQFPDLGLPPARSHFRSCIDSELMKKHNLITPEDFVLKLSPVVPAPQAPLMPDYACDTKSSTRKKNDDHEGPTNPTPLLLRGSQGDHIDSSWDNSSGIILPHLPARNPLPRHDVWKEELDPAQREKNRADLANLHARVDFLKNPRYAPPSAIGGGRSLVKASKRQPKETGIKPKPEKNESVCESDDESREPSVVFLPSPQVVSFKEYAVGQVYETTLELKNVTAALRPVRVIPPKSPYFSVGLGQFPGEHGLVAPGMSCHYTIRFAPDSLGDFNDELLIQSQASTLLTVQLIGHRTPPVLSLPSLLDIGHCLVGGCKVVEVTVYNIGGPGRFCLIPRSAWPATNFKKSVSNGCAMAPPFEVRPPVLELAHNEGTVIEVIFAPQAVEKYTQTITAVCDNCHVQHFEIVGEGQIANVEIVEMEDGLSEPFPGEVCDDSATHLVRFGPLNPYTYLQRRLRVCNKANVEIPFNWVVVRPNLKPLQPPPAEGESTPDLPTEDEDKVSERIQDAETAFGVEPESGVLPPGGMSQFVVTFAPPEVGDFHSVLHLVMRNIPHVLVPPGDLQERPASQTSDGVPEITLPPSRPNETSVEDVTTLELEAKGLCEPFNVLLQPYAIYLPGQILVTSSSKKIFKMVNLSVSSILFQWENFSADYILQVEPPFGELGPQEEMDLELTVSSSVPGKIKHTLMCHVRHLAQPLALHVEAEIKGPEIVIDNPDINFGLVRLGDSVATTLSLHNTSQVAAMWNLKESEEHQEQQEHNEENQIMFTTSSGELTPLATREIEVRFTPHHCQSLRTILELNVTDGNRSTIAVSAEVQDPAVCLLSCDLVLNDTYVDVPVCRQVSLLNQTLLATTFEWGKLQGEQAKMCSVTMDPNSGHIGPRETLDINLHFTAHRTGTMSDLKVPCHIAGMEQPLYLSLFSEILGLSVSYRTPGMEEKSSDDSPSSDLLLDFGHIELGANPKKIIYMRNNSGITAPFNITVEHFYAKPPTPPENRPSKMMPNKSQRRSLLAKTSNLADPLSKTPSQVHAESKAQANMCRTMLREGRGAAFTVSPSSGMLQPFAEQAIEVTAYCDMWGNYKDRLICRVERLDLVHIPVKMSVSGCPLQFQMVAAQPSQKPVLRFGTHVSGVGPISRQMRINNSSPFDIRLDWQIFNQAPNDSQTVDMVVTYGQAFPMCDSEGNEILPEFEDPESARTERQPSNIIPNTPEVDPISIDTEHSDSEILTVEQQRPKLITVTLRDHHGVEANLPYKFNPAQMVVPGRNNTCIGVSFHPQSEPEDTEQRDCLALALGYMSLERNVSCVGDLATRDQAYDVKPLKLNMTAHVKPALLSIECADDEGMCYRAAASDLVQNGLLIGEHVRLSHARLSNYTETSLVFRLLSTEPFFLVELDPSSRLPVAQLLQTELCELKPGQNMLVQLGFRNSLELLDYLATLSREPPESLEGVELESKDQERRLHFNQDLIIEFNNKSVQRLPLCATLTVPSLVLSKEKLDFGTCLVGQQRELQLMLSNPTASDSHWTVAFERKCKNCTGDTFKVTPDRGKLDAHITHVSNSKVLLHVYFTAKHTETYEAVLSFHGMLGETPALLSINGQGSYDGRHEAHVNI